MAFSFNLFCWTTVKTWINACLLDKIAAGLKENLKALGKLDHELRDFAIFHGHSLML